MDASYSPYGFDPKYTADVNYNAINITEPYKPMWQQTGLVLEAPALSQPSRARVDGFVLNAPEYATPLPGYTPYGYNPKIAKQNYGANRGVLGVIAGAGIALTAVPLIIGITMFVWRIGINKKILKGGRPGILAYIFHWDLWPIWGVDYQAKKAENIL